MIPIALLNMFTEDIWKLWTKGEDAHKLKYAQEFAIISIPGIYLRGVTVAYKCFLNG